MRIKRQSRVVCSGHVANVKLAKIFMELAFCLIVIWKSVAFKHKHANNVDRFASVLFGPKTENRNGNQFCFRLHICADGFWGEPIAAKRCRCRVYANRGHKIKMKIAHHLFAHPMHTRTHSFGVPRRVELRLKYQLENSICIWITFHLSKYKWVFEIEEFRRIYQRPMRCHRENYIFDLFAQRDRTCGQNLSPEPFFN